MFVCGKRDTVVREKEYLGETLYQQTRLEAHKDEAIKQSTSDPAMF
jgi:hypothetical protein